MKNKLFVNLLIPVLLLAGIGLFIMVGQPAEEIPAASSNEIALHFIDVGQGDSILAKLTGGRTMLIDAGTGSKADDLMKYLKSAGVTKIDYLIATHPHEDHIGGMDDIIKAFDIGAVYMPKATANTKAFENLLLAIKDKGLSVNTAKAGVTLIDEEDLNVRFLAPNAEAYKELNDYSAVTKITYGSTAFLLCGDAEKFSENEILASGADVAASVLKVGHHGSSTSSGKEFLAKVSPKIAVISLGKGNSYGHPHEVTLKSLADTGARIYRTDELGTIVITSDGVVLK